MAKFDFKSLNMQNIIDNIKSIVNPESTLPEAQEGDVIGNRLVSLMEDAKRLAQMQAEQTDALVKLNNELKGLFHDLEKQSEQGGSSGGGKEKSEAMKVTNTKTTREPAPKPKSSKPPQAEQPSSPDDESSSDK